MRPWIPTMLLLIAPGGPRAEGQSNTATPPDLTEGAYLGRLSCGADQGTIALRPGSER